MTKQPQDVALEIIEQAKVIISQELKHGLQVKKKTDNTPVTQIDTRINTVATELIGAHFPDDAIYAEESDREAGTSGYTWVIDPIDGTQALVLGLPTYTVCIARVAPDGQADVAYVYNPTAEELYQIERGGKALKQGLPMAVKACPGSLDGVSVYLSSRMPEESIDAGKLYDQLEAIGVKTVNTHAVASGALLVADGTIEAAVAGVTSPYEFAAVKPLVEAAGGMVRDLKGKPIERSDVPISGFIAAANAEVLHALVKLCTPDVIPKVRAEHVRTIHEYMPLAREIRHAPAGNINDVYIVDDTMVFRFPKTKEGRAILLLESAVVEKLKYHITLEIPHIVYVEPRGHFAETSYLSGKQLSREDIAWLATEKKRAFAQRISQFIQELNKVLPKDWLAAENAALPVNRKDDADYYAELLAVGKKKKNQYVIQYERYYHQLMAVRDTIFPADEIVVHGDLNSSNFFFNDANELVAVIDFGDCILHSIYFELRQLYQLGEDMVALVADAFVGAFGDISLELVRLFAVTHEFSVLMRSSLDEQVPYDNDRARLASALLHEWGEL